MQRDRDGWDNNGSGFVPTVQFATQPGATPKSPQDVKKLIQEAPLQLDPHDYQEIALALREKVVGAQVDTPLINPPAPQAQPVAAALAPPVQRQPEFARPRATHMHAPLTPYDIGKIIMDKKSPARVQQRNVGPAPSPFMADAFKFVFFDYSPHCLHGWVPSS